MADITVHCRTVWRQIHAQEATPEQVQASTSKTIEKPLQPNSQMVLGPISIRLVNEPIIGAIKKVAEMVRLRPVLDYDLIKSDKKINLVLDVATCLKHLMKFFRAWIFNIQSQKAVSLFLLRMKSHKLNLEQYEALLLML